MSVGKHNDGPRTVGVEVQEMKGYETEAWVRNYGVLDGGLEMMRWAWPSLEHKFSARRNGDKLPTAVDCQWTPRVILGAQRLPTSLLNKHPADMLVVKRGTQQRPPITLTRSAWEVLVDHTLACNRPRVVIEMWQTSAQLWSKGPMSKARVTVWEELGYRTSGRRVDGCVYMYTHFCILYIE
jgi:hypothetical protein